MLLLLSHFSHVRLCATPSLGFSRREHWSGLPFPSPMYEWKVKVNLLSRVQLFATPWTAAHQAPPSMGFSRQEYWSGVPLSSPIWSLKKKKKTVEGIWISWDSLLGIECQYHSHILTIKIHSLDLKDFLILDASRNLWIPIGGWVWCSQEHIGDYNHNTRATLWRGGIKNGYSVMQV